MAINVFPASVLQVYLCTLCVPDAWGSQKRALDTMDLELLMAVNPHVGAEVEPWSSSFT